MFVETTKPLTKIRLCRRYFTSLMAALALTTGLAVSAAVPQAKAENVAHGHRPRTRRRWTRRFGFQELIII